jgi:GNAT superfamily N-acetyltransferase
MSHGDEGRPQPPRAADVTIRPMRAQDAAAVAVAARSALTALYPEEVTAEEDLILSAAGTARAAHLQHTDPDGCWVADVEGQIVGTAIGLIREGVWGFSLFAVLPAFQGHGIGSRLYGARRDHPVLLASGRDRRLRPQSGLPTAAHGRRLWSLGSAAGTRRAALPAR